MEARQGLNAAMTFASTPTRMRCVTLWAATRASLLPGKQSKNRLTMFSLLGPMKPEMPDEQPLGSRIIGVGVALRQCMGQTDWSSMKGQGCRNPGTDNEGWVRADNFCSYLNERAEQNYQAMVGDGNYWMIGINDVVSLLTLDFTGQPWAYAQVRTEHFVLVYPKKKDNH